MEAQKTIPIAFSRLGPESRTAPFAMTARRFFGLDVGDWSWPFQNVLPQGSKRDQVAVRDDFPTLAILAMP